MSHNYVTEADCILAVVASVDTVCVTGTVVDAVDFGPHACPVACIVTAAVFETFFQFIHAYIFAQFHFVFIDTRQLLKDDVIKIRTFISNISGIN